MKYKNLHDLNTYQCHRNEVYLSGKDEDGKDFTIVFDTIELISWLDTPYMKEQAIKHIKEIGEVPNKINPKMKLSKEELMDCYEEEERSECCGAEFQPDSDLCPECKEHTGREI